MSSMFRGRNAQKASVQAARPSGVSQAYQVASGGNHSGSAGGQLAPAVNKVHQILARTTVPTAPWQGSTMQVEFALPAHLGKVVDNVLEFELSIRSTAPTGTITLSPTTYWCQKIEILNNAQVIEQVEADEIHHETVKYLTDQQFGQVASLINFEANGKTLANSASVALTSTAATYKYYLPLWANFLNTAQPMIRGFNSEWRFRLTLAPSITVAATGTPIITLASLTLYTTEANLADSAAAQLEHAHRQGVAYRSIIRNKFTKQEPTIGIATDYNVVMTTFTTDSAGLLVYVRPQSTDVDKVLDRSAMDHLALRDSANSELTINLPAQLIQGFIMPGAVSVPSGLVVNSFNNEFLFPFCSNLSQVLKTGKVLGGYKLTGQERVVLRPVAAQTNVTVCVVSYEYVIMTVQQGKVVIERRA